jgi:dTDP-4-amino-4,6-dideoxygalactose transaminase
MLLVAEPILGREEKTALSEVIDSGWITMGDRVRDFERAFAAAHGAADSAAVSSCTAALHLILQALGLGPEDEVLVPSLTFVATVNSVLYVGASPVFVDIEDLGWPLLSLADAAAKCTSRTKAVIVMHYAGYVADRDAWRDFADSRGLLLIEDAAHAAGVQQAGMFGHAAAFSFYGNKNMTTAEGGAVITRDEALLERIRQMRGHGLTSGTFQRFSNGTVGYDVTMLGFNYRMDELRASLGLSQLKHLSAWNEKRRCLTELYVQSLEDRCPDILLPFAHCQIRSTLSSAHHIMPCLLPARVDRQVVIERLRNAGVQTSNHYPPTHLFSFYQDRFPGVHLPRTEEFARRELTLPLHPGMAERHVEMVSTALANALTDRSRIREDRYDDAPASARAG